MRNLKLHEIDKFRDHSPAVRSFYGSVGDGTCGVFNIPSPVDSALLRVLASADGGWDHVSVSRRNRCPNWTEMEHVKRLLFRTDETAMQLHVAESEHLSLHPFCLHLWRPNDGREIPLPPAVFVAPPAEVIERLKKG